MDFKSITAGGQDRADALAALWPEILTRYPVKFWWFINHGYNPHIWQGLFHATPGADRLIRFRHLVAGRRGGKTLSAAWETLFYATHPEEYHRDFHGVENSRPLWMWVMSEDYKIGGPSLMTFLEVIRTAGLVKDRDYRWNKTEKVFEFYRDGDELLSRVEFKSAVDPQSLRGAGLDWLWIDEAAFLRTDDAWIVVYPGLTDKQGAVVTTTTPHGKNWFFEEFFSGDVMHDPDQFRVEYTSIDNPYFRKTEWERALRRYHPTQFKQEFMASFDAMSGIALDGGWLRYFVRGNPDIQSDDISLKPYLSEDGLSYKGLRLLMGVDPAISLSDKADHFAMALIGLAKDNSVAFLLDTYEDRIAFPDQLDKIREWFLKYRPEQIGIEAVAYQRALAQMAQRMDGMPNITAVFPPKGIKKEDRILSLGPFAKVGRLRISKQHHTFISRWVSYNPEDKNPNDDLLDAVEIALGIGGVLLARNLTGGANFDLDLPGGKSLQEEADAALKQALTRNHQKYDPELGIEI